MPNKNQRDTIDRALLRTLADIAGLIGLLVLVRTMDAAQRLLQPEVVAARVIPVCGPIGVEAKLRWRGPWMIRQSTSLALATLTAPALVLVGTLLCMNSHSDHPQFWWSFPGIVIFTNALAIVCTNHRHHRSGFACSAALGRFHAHSAVMTGASLFMFAGWASGLLPDLVDLLWGACGLPAQLLYSSAIAAAFGVLSFAHVGVIHARLCFQVSSAKA